MHEFPHSDLGPTSGLVTTNVSRPTPPPTPFLALILLRALGLLLLPGCISPPASYQKVDQTTLAYQSAVTAETVRLEATGLTARQAERAAVKSVTEHFIAAEAKRRKDLIAPLLDTIKAMEQPAGCWAFTLTTTTKQDFVDTTVEIGIYDPSQAKDKQWTLVSTDGEAPDVKAQVAYRKQHNSDWDFPYGDIKDIKDDKARGIDRPNWIVQEALENNFALQPSNPGTTTFVFEEAKARSVPLLVSLGPARLTFVLENATGTLRQVTVAMGAISVGVEAYKIDHLNQTFDFSVVDPSVPPMIAKVTIIESGRLVVGGTWTEERVYSGYHRVVCVDDRFQVKFGPLEEIDHSVPKQ